VGVILKNIMPMTNKITNKPFPWQTEQWQRLALAHQKNQLPHALLFSGMAGTGKQHFAQQLAQLILCKIPKQELPCDTCSSCLLFKTHNHPDYFFLQAEAESKHLKIDALRALIIDLQQTSQQNGYKVAILCADQLNTAAANALLKTLEEPTRNTIIILLTDAVEILLPTVRSRCQMVDFAPTWSVAAEQWLQAQGISDAKQWLNLAEGAPLRALQYAQDETLRTQYDNFFSALTLFWQQGDLINTATKWQKLDSTQCVIWLWQVYLDLLRLLTSGHHSRVTHDTQRLLLINQLNHYSSQQLLNSINIIQTRLQLLHQHSTLNIQLQLEALLIEVQHAKNS
jgi:DNA polymerase III subunit delta'